MNQKTKILMLSENFFPLSTASAQRSFAFAKTLALHSYNVILITKSPINLKSEKLTVIGHNTRREIPVIDPILLFSYLVESIRIIRKHSAHMIMSTVPKINNAIAGFLLSKLFRIPHIVDIRDDWESELLEYPFSHIFPRQLASLLTQVSSSIHRKADAIVTVNQTLKDIIHKKGVPYRNIFLIPNGVDTSLFRPCKNEMQKRRFRKKYRLPLSKIIFVYAGSLVHYYKLDIVLKGMTRLVKTHNEFIFLIIGRPTMLISNKRVLEMVEKLGLKDKVKVLGPLPVQETAEMLRCSDVGVIPLEDREIWKCMTTVKLFTYLASGLPVLASGPKDSELEKFINEHQVGVYIPKTNPRAFEEEIRKLLKEKSQIRKMGLKGRKIMESLYDRYSLCLKIVPVVHQVINQRNLQIQGCGEQRRKTYG